MPAAERFLASTAKLKLVTKKAIANQVVERVRTFPLPALPKIV